MSSGPVSISIRLLGPVEVFVDDRPVSFDTRKAMALLAYLAVVRRPTSRDTLAALLWPESDGTDARNAFRRTLSVLRAGLDGKGLIVDRSAVALDGESLDTDLWRFREALARARGHDHPPADPCPACLAALDEALSWDRGPFMDGFSLRDSEEFDDWQATEAEGHRRDLAGALERVARARANERRWDVTIEAARRWLAVDPLHEPAHQLMIATLARSGETAAAIAHYRDLVRMLDRELGVAPLPETTDLFEAIRDGRQGPGDGRAPSSKAPTGMAGALKTGAATGSDLATRLPLVGRDGELARLTDAVAAVGPNGRLLLIEGEAGVGKTRLAEAVAEAARAAGVTVLEGRTVVGEATIPFAVIAELIRGAATDAEVLARLATLPERSQVDAARLVALPGLATSGHATLTSPDPYGRLRVLESLSAVLAAMAAGRAGGLIWVDDIDRADSSSAEVIAYLARRLQGRRVAVLLSGRFEAADVPRLPAALTAVLRGADPRIALGRLDRAAVSALAVGALGVDATPEVLETLAARSEGLPLYLAEALASPDPTGAALPGGMLDLIRGRIASVDDVGRQVLAAAAVIGRSFDFATVREAAGRGEEETVDGLETLLARGIIREVHPSANGDVRYDFTHGRLRDVVYEDTSLARRRLLHGRVADALSRSGSGLGDSARWARIASHSSLAGRTDAAASAHLRAGRMARAVFANPEAREHFESALALGHPEVAEIHEALGDLLTLEGDYAGAVGHYETAEVHGDPAIEASIERRIGLVHVRRGDIVRAERHLAHAFDRATDEREAGRILLDRAATAIWRGDLVEADRLARIALATATEHDDPLEVARGRAMLGVSARRAGDLSTARQHLGAAIDSSDVADRRPAAQGSPDPGVRISALNTLALVEMDDGDPAAAEALFRDALERCERQGDRHRQAALENGLADALHAQGRSEDSMEHLKHAVALFADIGSQDGELEPEVWKLVEW
jgi:DNA-binding SARP family transcriptional activator/Tfp pilus assembly protein PilF